MGSESEDVNVEEVDYRMEDVRVWFRCFICKGFLPSIPELRKHGLEYHQINRMKLPEHLPPGALEGKIFFKPLPLDWMDRQSHSHKQSLIRVRSVSELQENEDDNENMEDDGSALQIQIDVEQEPDKGNDEANNVPITSPPDSGMFDEDSEQHDDDATVVNQPRTIIPQKTNATDDTSSVSAQKVFACHICNSKYVSRGPLNFHIRKSHPDTTPPVPHCTENLRLTIRRNATGTFCTEQSLEAETADGVPQFDDVESEETLNSVKRKRRSSSSSSSAATAVVPFSQGRNLMEKQFLEPLAKQSKGDPTEAVSGDESNSDCSFNKRKKKSRAKPLRITPSESESEKDGDTPGPSNATSKRRLSATRRCRNKKPSESESVSYSEESRSSSPGTASAISSNRSTGGETASLSGGSGTSTPSDEDSLPKLTDQEDDTGNSNNKSGSVEFDSDSDSDDLFVPVPKTTKSSSKNSAKASSGSQKAQTSSKNKSKKTEPPPTQSTTVCSTCGIQTKDANALLKHIKEFHRTNKPIGLVCGFCQKRYTDRNYFNKHIIKHTNEKGEA